jgi:hypothetical protein
VVLAEALEQSDQVGLRSDQWLSERPCRCCRYADGQPLGTRGVNKKSLSYWQRRVLADLAAIAEAFPEDVAIQGGYRLDSKGSMSFGCDRRHSTGTVVDAVEPRIRELLQACPTMPATVIAERIEWRYSIRTMSGRVAELRPVYLPPPASRTSYLAGEIAQCEPHHNTLRTRNVAITARTRGPSYGIIARRPVPSALGTCVPRW